MRHVADVFQGSLHETTGNVAGERVWRRGGGFDAGAWRRQSRASAAEQVRRRSESRKLTPAQRGVDASNELKGANWKPVFLDEHQNETLIILSDLIIPATDTPGAKEALVNRYIDLVMAAETHENQKTFWAISPTSMARACGSTKTRFDICRAKIRTICCT